MPEKTYHPRFLHSAQYYRAVLRALIEGLNARLSDQAIAESLASKGLLAPSGKQWTATSVKHALYRIRHHKTHPNRLYNFLIRFVFDGAMTVAESWVLFERRPNAAAM